MFMKATIAPSFCFVFVIFSIHFTSIPSTRDYIIPRFTIRPENFEIPLEVQDGSSIRKWQIIDPKTLSRWGTCTCRRTRRGLVLLCTYINHLKRGSVRQACSWKTKRWGWYRRVRKDIFIISSRCRNMFFLIHHEFCIPCRAPATSLDFFHAGQEHIWNFRGRQKCDSKCLTEAKIRIGSAEVVHFVVNEDERVEEPLKRLFWVFLGSAVPIPPYWCLQFVERRLQLMRTHGDKISIYLATMHVDEIKMMKNLE